MIAQLDSSLSVLSVARVQFSTVFQGIFPWLITCDALYTVQGVPTSRVARPWKKAFNLMKIMRCQRISLVNGRNTNSNITYLCVHITVKLG